MKRSLLFIPGHRPAQMQTADLLAADGIVFDLEDAVDPDEKPSARTLVANYLAAHRSLNFTSIVRINAVDSTFFQEDVRMVLKAKPDAVLLPKATVDSVKTASTALSGSTIRLFALIETAKGLFDVERIAESGLVDTICFGAEDFRADMGVEREADGIELLFPRARIAAACKAFRLEAVDTPFIDTYDDAGLIADARKAKALGFDGKFCIHPGQVDVVNRVFSPSPEQIAQATRIVDAWKEKQKQSIGVFRLDGKMIDKPVAEQAFRLLERARQSGEKKR